MTGNPMSPEPAATTPAQPAATLRNGNRRGDPSSAPRCQARCRRSGLPCRQPAIRGRRVCRLHGGKGGAPRGPKNGQWRHGGYGAEVRRALGAGNHVRRAMSALIRSVTRPPRTG